MRITPHLVRVWADEGGIADLTLAELDYRLTQALAAIYTDAYLQGRLYLNKLCFPSTNRLSVDLDFNVVGPKAEVMQQRQQIARRLVDLLAAQDMAYTLTHDYRYEQSTIEAAYVPLSGLAKQRLKLEISYIERVAILGREERPLTVPDQPHPLTVATYRLEELAATKLRALYGRSKGRDIYDLYQISEHPLDHRALRKLVLYCFYHARMIFSYPTFVANIEAKIRQRAFADDVRGLIRVGHGFDWQRACQAVAERFAFLGQLDQRDHLFLDLARYLLGRPIADARMALVQQIEHPLAWLMEGVPISPEAAIMRQEDIRLFRPEEDAG